MLCVVTYNYVVSGQFIMFSERSIGFYSTLSVSVTSLLRILVEEIPLMQLNALILGDIVPNFEVSVFLIMSFFFLFV